MDIILVGEPTSKRTRFYSAAAKELGETVKVIGYDEFVKSDFTGGFIKIDPPVYNCSDINMENPCAQSYREFLIETDRKYKNRQCDSNLHKGIVFINNPTMLAELLDKRTCKETLLGHGCLATMMLPCEIRSQDMLISFMQEHRISSVFIKPRYGSGAAGIMAYRYNLKNGRQMLYTSCVMLEGNLVNTKNIHVFSEKKEIQEMLAKIFAEEIVIEKWYPKDTFEGSGYDIRVVYQYGTADYIVVRKSRGPITNLHLNNKACYINEIGLKEKEIEDITLLCTRAMECFPGINYAGIDILIHKETRKPYVIEVNGQGDLIYQDIYHENIIYKRQVQQIIQWNSRKYQD